MTFLKYILNIAAFIFACLAIYAATRMAIGGFMGYQADFIPNLQCLIGSLVMGKILYEK